MGGNDAQKKQRQVNIDKAMDLKLLGLSYRKIAKEMEISVSTAFKYVKSAVDVIIDSYTLKAERVVAMELVKLDRLETIANKLTLKDKTIKDGIDKILKIMDRRSKYLALDAPAKTDLNISTPEDKTIIVEFVNADKDIDDNGPPADSA